MLEFFTGWYRRYFSDPQAVLLAVLLVLGFAVIIWLGGILAPVLAAIVIAYLLEGLVCVLERRSLPRLPVVIAVFVLFLIACLLIGLGLLPLLARELTRFLQDFPSMLGRWQESLLLLPEKYPDLISVDQVGEVLSALRSGIGDYGQSILSNSLASIPALITVLIYLILVPVLVFFFLKDKHRIVTWVTAFLPDERSLVVRVWREMDQQMGNYVRGKVWEIFITGSVTYIVFALMGLSYAPLLGVLVGLSVIVPYIGAAVVTLPVALVAYFQWGWGSEFAWLLFAYAVIQALDGNVLVPLLFSEAVNLHPVAIIVAVVFFGGLWGLWGVFFAIPLATLVKALLNVWPNAPQQASA